MIRFLALKILSIFDFYYQKKLFSFLKNRGYRNFNFLFDVGAHHGESIKLFLSNFKIKNIASVNHSLLTQKTEAVGRKRKKKMRRTEKEENPKND